MPNKINATILLVLINLGIQAQNFNAGLTLGIAATQVDGDGYGGFDKAGPIGGIWVSRNFHRNWFGRMELRYTQKGSYAKTSTETSSFYRMRLHYFEVPLLTGEDTISDALKKLEQYDLENVPVVFSTEDTRVSGFLSQGP